MPSYLKHGHHFSEPPTTEFFHCVGIAKSKPSGICENQIKRENRAVVQALLQNIRRMIQAGHEVKEEEFLNVATRALCVKVHSGQAAACAKEWKIVVEQEEKQKLALRLGIGKPKVEGMDKEEVKAERSDMKVKPMDDDGIPRSQSTRNENVDQAKIFEKPKATGVATEAKDQDDIEKKIRQPATLEKKMIFGNPIHGKIQETQQSQEKTEKDEEQSPEEGEDTYEVLARGGPETKRKKVRALFQTPTQAPHSTQTRIFAEPTTTGLDQHYKSASGMEDTKEDRSNAKVTFSLLVNFNFGLATPPTTPQKKLKEVMIANAQAQSPDSPLTPLASRQKPVYTPKNFDFRKEDADAISFTPVRTIANPFASQLVKDQDELYKNRVPGAKQTLLRADSPSMWSSQLTLIEAEEDEDLESDESSLLRDFERVDVQEAKNAKLNLDGGGSLDGSQDAVKLHVLLSWAERMLLGLWIG